MLRKKKLLSGVQKVNAALNGFLTARDQLNDAIVDLGEELDTHDYRTEEEVRRHDQFLQFQADKRGELVKATESARNAVKQITAIVGEDV